jgi:hypothetical protein
MIPRSIHLVSMQMVNFQIISDLYAIGKPITMTTNVNVYEEYLAFINSKYFAPAVQKPFRVMYMPPETRTTTVTINAPGKEKLDGKHTKIIYSNFKVLITFLR